MSELLRAGVGFILLFFLFVLGLMWLGEMLGEGVACIIGILVVGAAIGAVIWALPS